MAKRHLLKKKIRLWQNWEVLSMSNPTTVKKMATREAYGEALAALGAQYPEIVVLDADLSKSTKTDVFAKKYPERFFDMGIAEQNMMGVAAGMAAGGLKPFASTFAMFAAGRAFEIIRNSICYPNLSVRICATHAGITVGEDGASHQAIEDIALMRAIPNMTVIQPSDGVSTRALIKACVDVEGPVYVRLGRAAVPMLYNEETTFEIGKAKMVREGRDVTLIATGIMVNEAVKAASTLEAQGISVRVVDVHTLKPMDGEMILKAAAETKLIVTAEEHSIIGGLGSAVAEITAEACPVKVVRVGIRDTFGESGTPDALMHKYGLTATHLVETVLKNLK
jgi:transketolase